MKINIQYVQYMQQLFITVHVSQYLQARNQSCRTSQHKNNVSS